MSKRNSFDRLFATMDSGDYEDYGQASLCGLSVEGDKVSLDIEISDWAFEPSTGEWGLWRITALGVLNLRVIGANADPIQLKDQHPTLWEFVEPSRDLYFTGKPTSSAALIGDLVVAIRELSDDWLDPSAFVRFYTPPWLEKSLLDGGYGLLARGPKSVMDLVERLATAHGLEISSLGERKVQKRGLKVFLFGRSYVIARSFNAELLVSRRRPEGSDLEGGYYGPPLAIGGPRGSLR